MCKKNGNACVLRYFSTGQSLRSFAFSFRIDHYTVGKTMDQVLDIAVNFQERWNFPNVIGC